MFSNEGETSFTCFNDESDCSSKACTGNISDAVSFTKQEGEEAQIWLKINTDHNTRNTAAIWEINLSSSNDSSKLQGIGDIKSMKNY